MSLTRLVLTSILGAEPDNMVALAQDVAQRVYWGRSGNGQDKVNVVGLSQDVVYVGALRHFL